MWRIQTYLSIAVALCVALSISPLRQWLSTVIFPQPLTHVPEDWNHYQVLGVDDYEPDENVIKSAYKRRVLDWHPDRTRSDTSALLQRARESFEVLRDSQQRAEYAQRLKLYHMRRQQQRAGDHPLDWSLRHPLIHSMYSAASLTNAFLVLLSLGIMSWVLETVIPISFRMISGVFAPHRVDTPAERSKAKEKREAAIRAARENQQLLYRQGLKERQKIRQR